MSLPQLETEAAIRARLEKEGIKMLADGRSWLTVDQNGGKKRFLSLPALVDHWFEPEKGKDEK